MSALEKTAVFEKKTGLWLWLTPLALFLGLCGIWSLLAAGGELMVFWPWPVLAALALLLPFGWVLEKRKKWVKWCLLLWLGLLALIFWLFQTQLTAQFYALFQSVAQGADSVLDVTGAVCFFTAALLWLLGICLWARQIWLVWILVTALLAAPPLLGRTLPWGTVFCLVFFQAAFAALAYGRRKSRRRKVVLQGRNGSAAVQKSGLSVGILMVAVLLAGMLVVNLFGQPLYQATGYLQYQIAQFQQIALPFAANSTVVSSGVINRGNLIVSGEEQMTAYTDSRPTETLYLKGFTGGDYQEGVWNEAEESQLFAAVEQQMGESWNGRGSSVFRTMYYDLNQWSAPENAALSRTLTLRGRYGRDNSWYPPYYYNYDTTYQLQEGYRFSYYQRSDIALRWEEMEARRYTAESYRRLQEYYREQALSVYTQVPLDTVPRLVQLCRDNPQEDLNSIIDFVRQTLAGRIRYTTSPGQIPYGQDPVEYTLFERGQGYCQHFASAAVLMLRLYGIPARYVSGYALTPSDFEEQENGGYLASVTDASAHAWAEIFLEDYGWVPIEVTFGGSFNALPEEENTQSQTSSSSVSQTSSSTQSRQEVSALSSPSVLEGETFDSTEEQEGSSLPAWFWWVLGGVIAVLLLAAALLAWRAVRLRRLKVRLSPANGKSARRWEKLRRMGLPLPDWVGQTAQDVRSEWSRMLRVLRFGGYWKEGKEPAEEYLRRHPETNPFLSPEEMLQLLDIVGQAAYGTTPVKEQQAKQVQRAYLRTARGVYQKLPWYRKIWFKWFWVAL